MTRAKRLAGILVLLAAWHTLAACRPGASYDVVIRRGTLFDGSANPPTVADFADLAIFDPATIQDHATFDNPRQYATGMVHVFVNGIQVLKDGEHKGATPARVVRGPGWKGTE